MGARTSSRTSESIGLGLRWTVSEERPLIARTRYLRRIVGRATVGHDHGINEMARQCSDDGADKTRLR